MVLDIFPPPWVFLRHSQAHSPNRVRRRLVSDQRQNRKQPLFRFPLVGDQTGASVIVSTFWWKEQIQNAKKIYISAMQPNFPIEYPQFYTATILEWKPLLAEDKHKEIIVNSLQFLVTQNRIILHAFVIMSNHIHLIWQPTFAYSLTDIQSSFMKYTAQQLKHSLNENDKTMLEEFKVNKYDRAY